MGNNKKGSITKSSKRKFYSSVIRSKTQFGTKDGKYIAITYVKKLYPSRIQIITGVVSRNRQTAFVSTILYVCVFDECTHTMSGSRA